MKKSLFLCLSALLLVVTGCKKEVESVTVMPESIILSVGETYQLQSVVKPDKAPQEVKWMSSRPMVATVSANGLVTAIAAGECEISVYADVQKAVCRVKVTAGGNGIPGDTTGTNPGDTTQTETFTVNGVSFTMVAVKGGTFTMGATPEQGDDAFDSEMPAHSVTLSDYCIGQTEVTQELWQAVMGSNPSYIKGSKLPVECVSWDDCQQFIAKLNQLTGKTFRLPTEAEWEYAARGGSKSGGYKYSGSNSIGDVAWYEDNSGDKTHPVGTKQPNELGLYDMSGNVWEWCQDWYGSYGSGSQTDPQGPSSGDSRVFRGGSWYYFVRNCRVSLRDHSRPAYRYYNLGLRLAL